MEEDRPVPTDLTPMASMIDQAMLTDRYGLNKLLRRIRRAQRRQRPFDRDLEKLNQWLSRSMKLRTLREQQVPQIEFPDQLPVSAHVSALTEALSAHQVLVVCGETGSGKSTQLPKICLAAGRGRGGMIGHTQPRRIAARTIANRISEELGTTAGEQVGYQIRFSDTTRPETLVKLMTDGILLGETRSDRFLSRYDTIIIDEAHERSLNIDFLLGYLHRLLPKRPDLKLIITSATIDAERFADHFRTDDQPAPIIEVSGRTYPVEIRYRPVEALVEDDAEPDAMEAIIKAVDELARIDHGHILIFLPTERDIHELMKLLRSRVIPGDRSGQQTEILPLYARLTNADQNRVFQSRNYRRIVVTTNVAESSLTVPGIRYVIDAGTARISRYSARSGIQRLPIEPISQASANQRAGRCGRLSDGICLRMYSETDFDSREPFTAPEILRTNLAAVILQTISLQLGALEEFPFLDPPRPTAIQAGYQTLFELGAIDDRNQLTSIGKQLARLPVDPRIGRLILAADEENCLHEALIIASVLELRDPRDRPFEKREAADQAHAQFRNEDSDFLSFLQIWDFYHERKSQLSRNQLRKACQRQFLSYNRLREWSDVFGQLRRLVEQNGMRPGPRREDASDSIHRALLAGLPGRIAYLPEKSEYLVASGGKAFVWPGSGLAARNPKWLICAEIVETNRRYLRTAARIRPDWIEPATAHLIRKHHGTPYWSARRGAAVTDERVTLHALTIVPRRQITLARIDPERARELLILHGFIEQDWDEQFDFLDKNRSLRQQLEQRQARTRQHDLLRGEEAELEFYDRNLPEDVCDLARLRKWLRRSSHGAQCLTMQESDLCEQASNEDLDSSFPESIEFSDSRFELEYHLEPGTEEDGVTIVVPAAGLSQLRPQQLGWLVPGLLEEKITALIKSLPKDLRRQLIPAPDTARQVAAAIQFGKGDLEAEVAVHLSAIAGEPITQAQFRTDQMPRHLRMNVRIVDESGDILGEGRELGDLQSRLGPSASSASSSPLQFDWISEHLEDWPDADFPVETSCTQGGVRVKVYPSLIDRMDHVDLVPLTDRSFSKREHRRGLRRLAVLRLRRALKQQVDWLPQLDRMELYASAIPSLHPLRKQLAVLLADRAGFRIAGKTPGTGSEFTDWLARTRNQLSVAVQDLARLILPILESAHQARRALEELPAGAFPESVADIKEQFSNLLTPRFLEDTPWEWLQQYPRYFKAIIARSQKLNRATAMRDAEAARQLRMFLARYETLRVENENRQCYDAELEHFRWMIQEYRVSLFAQELRTIVKISETRLERQWQRVGKQS